MVMGMPSAVMDMPTPRDISMVFVKQYYTLLNEAPDHVHRFYSQDSSFVHGGLERGKKSETKTAMGQKEINDRIQKLQFRDARTKIKQVDAHPTLGGGVVIQVSGQLSNNGAPMRPFMQTFVLAPQTTHNYYVYNDIFRYQDDLFSDDEEAGDGAAEADDEAEPESPPVPPPAASAPTPAPAPAPAPAAATASAPTPAAEQPAAASAATTPGTAGAAPPAGYGQPAQVNGHGAAPTTTAPDQQEPTPPASPPPATAAEPMETEAPAVSPQPRQPSPQPRQPSPQPVSSEPKTYANLFKAPSGRPAAPPPPRPATDNKDQSPPSRAAAPAPPRPAPAPAAAARPDPPEPSAPAGSATGGGAAAGDTGERRRPPIIHPDSHQIFLGNLPQDVSNNELIEHFSKFGEVVDIRIHSSKPPAKGVPPRSYPHYGFISFDSPEAVVRVLQAMPVKLSRQGGEEEHRINIEKKQQQRPGEGRGRGDRPGGAGRGGYGRGAPRGRAGYGRGGDMRGRGGYQPGPRR